MRLQVFPGDTDIRPRSGLEIVKEESLAEYELIALTCLLSMSGILSIVLLTLKRIDREDKNGRSDPDR